MEAEAQTPADRRALVAVDLGAESCRVSLLRWQSDDSPCITLVKRFENHARHAEDGTLRWNIGDIEAGVNEGIREAAAIATEGIRSIAVDGWAVDYARLDINGKLLADPYCYRDERTLEAEKAAHAILPAERLRELNGIQQMRLNTIYQLYADKLAEERGTQDPGFYWLNLPEYLLYRWGARQVGEWTNATHTGMVAIGQLAWATEIVDALDLSPFSQPRLVYPGTVVGKLKGELAELPALSNTALIAPACHDTASAIAGIAAHGEDWAYLSSGTWSLVGAVLDNPCNTSEAREHNFTNLGAAGGRTLFHKNVNGMWLLRQCMEAWAEQGHTWTVQELVAAAETAALPTGLIEVDDPNLMLQGHMPQRINEQRRERKLPELDESPTNAPQFALLIFHSLAARYAEVLNKISNLTGRKFTRLYIVGGGSQNELLNGLTAQATGLAVHRGHCESSTIGNFAIQLAALQSPSHKGVTAEAVSQWANKLHPCR